MELTHTLNGVVIDEPIGFDDFKTTIKRGAYHGMSAEMSVGTLEFYGSAAETIMEAYESNIDTELVYMVKSGDVVVYRGVVDLSTISAHSGDYCSVSCKVGEIGAKTTFNNRTETEVDLNTSKTIDGADTLHEPLWKEVAIPTKHLLYTDRLEEKRGKVHEEPALMTLTENKRCHWISIVPDTQFVEFGESGTLTRVMGGYGSGDVNNNEMCRLSDDTQMASFLSNGDFIDTYGRNTTMDVEIDVNINVEFLADIFSRMEVTNPTMSAHFYLMAVPHGETTKAAVPMPNPDTSSADYYGYPDKVVDPTTGELVIGYWRRYIAMESQLGLLFSNTNKTGTFHMSGTLTNISTDLDLFLGVSLYNYNQGQRGLDFGFAYNDEPVVRVTIEKGSYIRMRMFDKVETEEVRADIMPVHEVLNNIAEKISENALSVKSDWFSRADSQVNPKEFTNIYDAFGGGSLKGITNGYKIRGLYKDEDHERNMAVSFKNAIESLDMLDAIGWGFSTEAGQTYVRVERWPWFYKDDVVLSIDNPKEYTRGVVTDDIFHEMQIGFKKYETQDAFNSIDSVHGERTFTSSLKAVSNQLKRDCGWIADNYAIEKTRRSKEQTDPSVETTYDESIFVFELNAVSDPRNPRTGNGYQIPNNVVSASGVERVAEQYNVQLSPRRCAERWRDRLFCTHTQQRPFNFTSGKINYTAEFSCHQPTIIINNRAYSYLQDVVNGEVLKEDAAIEYVSPLFISENVKLTYPITASQYAEIMANPYGIVEVDGEKYWIKELTYTFQTGECDFTLIPKNE